VEQMKQADESASILEWLGDEPIRDETDPRTPEQVEMDEMFDDWEAQKTELRSQLR